MVNILNKTSSEKFSLDFKRNICKIYAIILSELSDNDDSNNGVSLIIVDDEEMKILCKKYYENKITTDVLAFHNDKNITHQVGDIVISIDVVKQQYKNYNNTIEEELYFLFIHGCLHLFGFNHIDPGEEKFMTTMEKKILDRFNQKND